MAIYPAVHKTIPCDEAAVLAKTQVFPLRNSDLAIYPLNLIFLICEMSTELIGLL